MTTQQTIDQAKADAFVGKVLADTAALAVTVMSSISIYQRDKWPHEPTTNNGCSPLQVSLIVQKNGL